MRNNSFLRFGWQPLIHSAHGQTPAMNAELTNHVWTIEELILWKILTAVAFCEISIGRVNAGCNQSFKPFFSRHFVDSLINRTMHCAQTILSLVCVCRLGWEFFVRHDVDN